MGVIISLGLFRGIGASVKRCRSQLGVPQGTQRPMTIDRRLGRGIGGGTDIAGVAATTGKVALGPDPMASMG